MTLQKGPVALIVMDGYGLNPSSEGNAAAQANSPVLDRLFATRPWSRLQAHGEAVGLMSGQMGDSNVGHLNLGAGRVVLQYMLRILREAESGRIFDNPVLCNIMDKAAQTSGRLHFMGLVSHGGVHSHSKHLFALLEMAKERGVANCFVHAFMDGRDVPPSSGAKYMEELEHFCTTIGNARVASVSGRYFAMDRDQRWDRTQQAFKAIVAGQGLTAPDGLSAMRQAYERGETDEFVIPTVITDTAGDPVGNVRAQDVVFFFNFRADRARQLSKAFTEEEFAGFPRSGGLPQVTFASLTRYDDAFLFPYAYPPTDMINTLGEVVARQGWRQLHIAETEKYAHVTFFFNGGREEPFPGEDQVLIPSPKVATYDLQPEMSAIELTDRVVAEIARDHYEFILLNFANCDMVGHTGIMPAAVKAVETVDACVGRVIEALLAKGGQALVTADHGNVEEMIEKDTGGPHTFHTMNAVPCILVSNANSQAKMRDGILADVAPTLCELLEVAQPSEMDGQSLIAFKKGARI
ncbi:MAG: 2,3-bisphosphoglycerate-independent phosphoglycerate mutase [Limnochordia bacterium]